MNKFLFLILLVLYSNIWSQNLITNPSFELYDTCPSGPSNAFNYEIERCIGWYTPTLATSDYFNSCSLQSAVPNVTFGFQYAKEGTGMLGFLITLDKGLNSYYEYVQSRLLEPLLKNEIYKFSMYVNLADGSDYALRSIGAWFTSASLSQNTLGAIFYSTPNVVNSNGYLKDTVNWVLIDGYFQAQGGEEYITVGFYTDSLLPDTIKNNPIASPDVIYSYIYLDDLNLELVSNFSSVPNIITPNDDGINDEFRIPFNDFKLFIYNRWGIKVWHSNDEQRFWKGLTSNGDELSEGTYYYLIETLGYEYKGCVQLMK